MRKTLSGFAGAKSDSLTPGKNSICETWSMNRTATLKLIVEPPQAAGGMAMRMMLAANTKEPGMKVKDEPAPVAGAFTFETKEQLAAYDGMQRPRLEVDATSGGAIMNATAARYSVTQPITPSGPAPSGIHPCCSISERVAKLVV